jgi:hypothetical protein
MGAIARRPNAGMTKTIYARISPEIVMRIENVARRKAQTMNLTVENLLIKGLCAEGDPYESEVRDNAEKAVPNPKKRSRKPQRATNAINGDVTNSAFVVGENKGIVISGVPPADLDKRFTAVADRLSEELLSSLESK